MYQSLVTVDIWTWIAMICNLLLQMYLIKRFLLDKVLAVLDKRKAEANAQLADAEQANARALELKADYERSIESARDEAGQILSAAQQSASARSEEILSDARHQAELLRQRAENDIALERSKAVSELKDEIGSMAIEIASKVVEREINPDDHEALIEDFIRNVGGDAR